MARSFTGVTEAITLFGVPFIALSEDMRRRHRRDRKPTGPSAMLAGFATEKEGEL
jgi:hypothetical protein